MTTLTLSCYFLIWLKGSLAVSIDKEPIGANEIDGVVNEEGKKRIVGSDKKRMISARLEPETTSVLDWCNNQLHYKTTLIQPNTPFQFEYDVKSYTNTPLIG